MNLIYSINTATENDILLHLIECNDYFIPHLDSRINIHDFTKKIQCNAELFEAWNNLSLIGLVSAYFNNDTKIVFINHVCVLKSFQGYGISKKIISNCICYSKEKKYKFIKLEVYKNNFKAINLYKYFNFEIENEFDNYLIMQRIL